MSLAPPLLFLLMPMGVVEDAALESLSAFQDKTAQRLGPLLN
jgi:hypothetical protein